MGEKQKVLKIKVGEVYVDGKNLPVYNTAWKRVSKDKKTTYYEVRNPIFIQEIEINKKVESEDVL